MIDAICSELETRKNYLENQPIETIYFGGGTPSILLPEELTQLITTVHTHFNTSSLSELTLEANPDDITPETIAFWKASGINRLSIGLQSFKEGDLKWMNRAHTIQDSYSCVELAIQYGIENLTVDLIYGLPGLTNEEWVNHIETVIKMGAQHVSAYCLTIEEGTALDLFVEKGKIIPASENSQAEQFLLLVETLEKHGFSQYEISNFGKPGFESRHNSNYWKGVHYLGAGPSAHSYNGYSRSWNVRSNHTYMNAIEKQTSSFETEELTKTDVYNELLLTGLRTSYGVNLHQLEQIIPLDISFQTHVDQLCDQGLMIKNRDSICLTKNGRLQADRIASDLFRLSDPS